MIPYYEEKGITIYHGDCLEIMPDLLANSVDAIITDLPYGTTACKWDVVIPFEPMWAHVWRILKQNGVFITTASQPFTSALVMSNPRLFKYEWIWHKNSSGGFATAKKLPMKFHENIIVFYKNRPTYNPQFQEYSDSTKYRFKEGEKTNRQKQVRNSTNKIHAGLSFGGEQPVLFSRGKYPESVQKFNNQSNNKRLHPTQKPVALMEYLIKTYTNEGDTVLDFCMGSGTTGVACKHLNRNFIGIELEEKYFNIAKERIENIDPLFKVVGL